MLWVRGNLVNTAQHSTQITGEQKRFRSSRPVPWRVGSTLRSTNLEVAVHGHWIGGRAALDSIYFRLILLSVRCESGCSSINADFRCVLAVLSVMSCGWVSITHRYREWPGVLALLSQTKQHYGETHACCIFLWCYLFLAGTPEVDVDRRHHSYAAALCDPVLWSRVSTCSCWCWGMLYKRMVDLSFVFAQVPRRSALRQQQWSQRS